MIVREADKGKGWVVYGLKLVNAETYRYVGMTTTSAQQRGIEHESTARNSPKYPIHYWLRKHQGEVEMVMLSIRSPGGLDELAMEEQNWIARLRSEGHKLLNLTDGGEGPNGAVFSEAERKRRSEAVLGELNPNYGKYGTASHMYGREFSESTRKKLSDAKLGELNPMYGREVSEYRKELYSKLFTGSKNPKAKYSAHKRHHVNKEILNVECRYCRAGRVI